MTLVLTQINHDDLCHGWQWVVDDIEVLAERVARVAMGEYRHIAQILAGLNISPPKTRADQAADAIKKMQVSANGDPWQRDGWIFQTISWIAAHQQKHEAARLYLRLMFAVRPYGRVCGSAIDQGPPTRVYP
jgi:hypothetical protein